MTAFNPGDRVHVAFDGVLTPARTPEGDVKVTAIAGRVFAWVLPEHLSPVPTPVLFADINKGDRIRAVNEHETHEFPVAGVNSARVLSLFGFCFFDNWQFFRLTPPVAPEPEYEVGAVYQSATGATYRRLDDGWQDFNGIGHGHDFPARPLVRLVPEEPK